MFPQIPIFVTFFTPNEFASLIFIPHGGLEKLKGLKGAFTFLTLNSLSKVQKHKFKFSDVMRKCITCSHSVLPTIG